MVVGQGWRCKQKATTGLRTSGGVLGAKGNCCRRGTEIYEHLVENEQGWGK